MKTLVTGWKGFVGSHLVKKLKKEGCGVVFFNGDVTKDSITENVDVVYHLAAILDEDNKQLFHVNVDGTKNIVKFCKDHDCKLIYLSSAGVLSFDKVPVDENSPYHPETKYEKTKMIAERIIISSGIRYTILRSTIIIGPNKHWLEIVRAIKNGYPPVGGKNFFHLIYIEDVVDALIWALFHDGVYNIGAPDVLRFIDVYNLFCKYLGIQPKKSVSPTKALVLSYLYSIWLKLKREESQFIKRIPYIKRLLKNRKLCVNKIMNNGFVPKYNTEEAIKLTVERLKE